MRKITICNYETANISITEIFIEESRNYHKVFLSVKPQQSLEVRAGVQQMQKATVSFVSYMVDNRREGPVGS